MRCRSSTLRDKLDLPRVTGSNAWKWGERRSRHRSRQAGFQTDSAARFGLVGGFECELEFTRRSGAGGLNLNIPTRTGECSVVIDHASGNGGVFWERVAKGSCFRKGKRSKAGNTNSECHSPSRAESGPDHRLLKRQSHWTVDREPQRHRKGIDGTFPRKSPHQSLDSRRKQ